MAKLLSNTRVYGTATVDTQLFVRGSNSAHSTATGSLQVQGGIGVAGSGFFSGVVTATNFSGAFSGSATSANNINGGTAGQLVYQSAPSTTAFTGPGTAGQILISQGTSAPLYVNTTTFAVGLAANLLGGTAGQFVYQTAPNVTGFISTGSMYVGRAVVADSLASGSIGTAQNLAGGTAGQVPYQTAPGATSFYGPGVAGQIPVSAGAAAPVYTNTASIYVGRSNLSDDMAGGSAGQLLIQTAANVTDFISTGSAYVGRAVIADSVVGGTGFVNAVQQTANAAYYLTFVDSNNSVATAESIFTTSSFVVNPSTGNVGLGLTGPTEKLELSGAADTARIKITNVTSGRSSILAHDSSGFYWRPTNNGDVFQLRDSAGTGLVTLNPNTQFFGIGTSGPSERLHVDGAAADTRIRVSANDGTNFRGFEVRAGTSFKGGLFYRSTEGNVLQIWGPNGSTPAIHIDANNMVEIRATTSVHSVNSGALQVDGGLGVAGGGFFGGTVTATTFVGTFAGSVSQINTVQATTNASHFITFVDSNNTTASSETVYTNGNFVVNPGTGNIGIGTASPFSKLQVGSNTFSGGNGMFANDRVGISNHGSLTGLMLASTYNDATYPEYGLVFVQGPNTSNYNVWSLSPDGPAKGSNLNFIYGANASNIHTGAPRVVIQGSTGNVGIGTASPGAKLEIENGDLWLDAPGGGNPEIRLIDDGGISVAGAKIRYENNNGNLYIEHVWNQATSGIFFRNRTAGTALDTMTLMNGYVGIGNASPSYRLDVSAAASPFQTVARFGSGGSDILITHANAIISHNASYNGGWTRTGSGYAGLIDFQGGKFLFQTSPTSAAGSSSITDFTTRFQITNGGNVGVGPNSPSFTFDVTGTARATSDVRAPIFYDSDNTAYYADPASTSRLLNAEFFNGGIAYFYTVSNNSLRGYIQATDTDDQHFIIATSGGEDISFKDGGLSGSVNMVIRGNATVESYGDFRAPIFYDSNNTAYYTDPASTSILNVAYIYDYYVRRADSAATGINWYSPSYISWTEYMSPAGATGCGPTANITAPSGTLVTSWALRSFIENAGGYGWTFESGSGSSGQPSVVAEIRSSDGSAQFNGSVRTPIYYDSNDTGYYLDPASTSNLRQTNFFVQDNVTCSFTNPDLGSTYFNNRGNRYLTSNGSNWLADGRDAPLTISGSWSHTNRGLLGIALHNENNTNGTYSPSIIFGTMSNSGGYNSAYAFIMGRKTSANAGVDTNWNSGELHFYAVGTGYIGDTASMRLWNHGDMETITSIRSPIFYDYNNTGYYMDPEGTTNVNRVQTRRLAANPDGNTSDSTVGTIGLWTNPESTTSTMMFKRTDQTFGTHGGVTDIYATYWLMDTTNRGWIFRNASTGQNIFSISNNNGTTTLGTSFGAALAQLNVSQGQGSATTYRDIDLKGSWAGGEGHAITATHATGANNIVGQMVFEHNSPGSRIKFGRLYHSGDVGTYPMNLISNDGSGNARLEMNAGSDMRSPIFYDTNDTSYNLDLNGGSSLLRGRVNITGGHGSSSLRVYLAPGENGASTGLSTLQMWCSEPGNSWDWAGFGFNVDNNLNEGGNVPAYYFGRPNTGFGQAYMRMSTDGNWYFYNTPNGSNTRYLTLQLERTGYAIAYQSMRSPIFYDQDNTAFYADPNSTSVFSTHRVAAATSGWSLMVGQNSTTGVYNDNDRYGLVVNGPYYPHIYLTATANASNGTHGAVISMQGVLSAGGFRKWNIGIPNTNPDELSFGWHNNDPNPHYGVGINWSYPASMWIDTGHNLHTRGSVRTPIFYDRDDTTVRWDGNYMVLRGSSPTIYLRDTDHNVSMIHCNSNIFYVLRGSTDSESWSTVGSGWWPLEINLTNNNATFGGEVTSAYGMYSTIFYDRNNTAFYIDPNADLSIRVDGEICNSNYQAGAMQPGALNICRTDRDYRWDGTSWASDIRVGILANVSEFFEFAVHDSGDSVMSMFYFDGGSTIYMGRNIGWGQCNLNIPAGVYAGAYYYNSDRTLKDNILPISNALDKVLALNGVTYTWKDSGKAGIGLIAQEVEAVIPEVVSESVAVNEKNEETTIKNVNYGHLVGLLIESIKDLKTALDASNERIKQLEEKLNHN